MKISWDWQIDTQSSGPFTEPLMNEHIYTQTHECAHSSRSNSCRKHLERSNAHMSASLYAALHFSRESTLVGRRIHSPVLQFKNPKRTYGCDFCQCLPVPPPLPASPLCVSIGKISCPRSTAGRQQRISILSCTQWPTNLLDSTRHYTQLFPATFSIELQFNPSINSFAGCGYNFHSSKTSGFSRRALKPYFTTVGIYCENPSVSVWESKSTQ